MMRIQLWSILIELIFVLGKEELQPCKEGFFLCENKQSCISSGFVCDNEYDCDDGSDESAARNCPAAAQGHVAGQQLDFSCYPNHVLCPGTDTCIHVSQLCNGIVDCTQDSSDEGSQCYRDTTECESSCPHKDKCRAGPLGVPVCYCDEGYWVNGSNCTDINECLQERYCDQRTLCTNSNGSYTCACAQDYNLQGKGTCTADTKSQKPALYFTNTYSIQELDLSGNTSRKPIETHKAVALDFNIRNNTLCWIDTVSGKGGLACSSTQTHKRWSIPTQYNLNTVDDMAIDWMSGNIYFADKVRTMIFVCNSTGQVCLSLITSNLNRPRAIALDPIQRYIFFIERDITPLIYRASLSGTGGIALVKQKIVRPMGVTLDYANSHLYWADAYLNSIERINYDGQHRRTIIQGIKTAEHIFGLSVFENYIYATNRYANSIVKIDRLGHARYPVVKPVTLLPGLNKPGSIVVVHNVTQPIPQGEPYACTGNGGCEDVCLITDDGLSAKCHCREGYMLAEDNKTCTYSDPATFLMYTDARQGFIKGIEITTDNVTLPKQVIMPIESVLRPTSVDYDYRTGYLYYNDPDNYRIGRRHIDGSSRNDSFIVGGINSVNSLAIDWVGNNIYWSDEYLKRITVARIDNTALRKVIINTSIVKDIAVAPHDGFIFWTESVQGSSLLQYPASIKRASMTGRNVITIGRGNIINGISLHRGRKRVYWIDASPGFLKSVSFTGSNRQVS